MGDHISGNLSQAEAPLYRAVRRFLHKGAQPFHVPVHGRGAGAPWLREAGLKHFMRWDLTELDPLDDLHLPQGAIKRAQELTANLFKAKQSFFLVNGVTVGLLALFSAFVPRGGKVIITRLSHKAVLHGVILTGACPVYLPIEKEPSTGFPLNVSPRSLEKALQENPDCTLVLITSPSYWGVAADLSALRKITGRYGVMLAVDEAHGTHFPFYPEKLPHSAAAEADLWLQSAHKSLGALTPGAFLHLGKGARNAEIRFWLQALQTSSPSYPVMISLDLTRRQMALRGKKIFSRVWDWSLIARGDLHRNGFPLLRTEKVTRAGFFLDPGRLTLLFPSGGGRQFSALLAAKGCQPELETDGYILLIGGSSQLAYPPGNLIKALKESRCAFNHIDKKAGSPLKEVFPPAFFTDPVANCQGSSGKDFATFLLSPGEAINAPRVSLLSEKAVGEICGEMVIVSPPGLPLLSPGEIITEETLHFLLRKRASGILFQGANDPTLKRITIVRNPQTMV